MANANAYNCAWDFARLSLGVVSGTNGAIFSSATGGPAGNVGFTTGMYMHGSVGGTFDGVALAQLGTDMDANFHQKMLFKKLWLITPKSQECVSWNGFLVSYVQKRHVHWWKHKHLLGLLLILLSSFSGHVDLWKMAQTENIKLAYQMD